MSDFDRRAAIDALRRLELVQSPDDDDDRALRDAALWMTRALDEIERLRETNRRLHRRAQALGVTNDHR